MDEEPTVEQQLELAVDCMVEGLDMTERFQQRIQMLVFERDQARLCHEMLINELLPQGIQVSIPPWKEDDERWRDEE